MKFHPIESRLKKIMAAGIVTLVAIGILLNWTPAVSAENAAPAEPDTPTLRALHKGMVEVDWNDVSGADKYEVQFWGSDGWIGLPDTDLGIEAFFYGTRVVLTELPRAYSYDAFRVRAGNCLGWSDWSEYAWQTTTHDMDWEGIPVPAIEPTPEPANSPATGAPNIGGTVQVGETLSADTSGIADEDGLTDVSYCYQWIGNDGSDDSDIYGATSSTYTLVEADQGKTIKVKVSFSDDADNNETLTSMATAEVAARPNQPATGTPSVSGTAEVGETLTAYTSDIVDHDGLENATFRYQWIRNDGVDDADISGATSSTYTLVDTDQGKTVKVKVSFTDDASNDETLTSAATAEVAARSLPGQIETGSTLSSLSVSGQDGAAIDFGAFDPTDTTYSATVASTVEWVTVKATAAAGDWGEVYIIPGDASSSDEGHQVDLSHGTNLVLIGVQSFNPQTGDGLNTYSVAITRDGTASADTSSFSVGNTPTVSIHGNDQGRARKGSTIPFVLNRTGDIAQSLAVEVRVATSHPEEITSYLVKDRRRVSVEFAAGHASARLDAESISTPDEYSAGYFSAELLTGSGYQYDWNAPAYWQLWEDDFSSEFKMSELSVVDAEGSSVDIGTFDPNKNSYSGSVSSATEYVTLYFDADSVNGTIAHEGYLPIGLMRLYVLPGDSRQDIAGHQVALSHGTNQIVLAMVSNTEGKDGINAYTLWINRAGSPADNAAVVVRLTGIDRSSEGDGGIPYLLTRTGDTSEALAVQVEVAESGGDTVLATSEGQFDIEFQAGHASARLDVRTFDDEEWEEHSAVQVTVNPSTSYLVFAGSGPISTQVRDDDVPAMTAVLAVDSTEVEEGEEVTATVTVTTDGPKEPHSYAGNVHIRTSPLSGTARTKGEEVRPTLITTIVGQEQSNADTGNPYINRSDFELHAVNGGMGLFQDLFRALETNGVVTNYQAQYTAIITISDDDLPEPDETFDVWLSKSNSKKTLTFGKNSSSHTITILGSDETPVALEPFGYATVVVSDSGTSDSAFTVNWEDPQECTTKYRAGLIWHGPQHPQQQPDSLLPTSDFSEPFGISANNLPWLWRIDFGEAGGGENEITGSISNSVNLGGTDHAIEVRCFDDDPEIFIVDGVEYRIYTEWVVTEVTIPTSTLASGKRPKAGTYSTEPPLTALTVGSGTLSPEFSKFGFLYAVLDVPNEQTQITLNPTVKSGYTVSWDPTTDANYDTPGHQVDLGIGYNTLYLAVDHDQGGTSFNYEIVVKRAEGALQANSPATGAPTISGTAQVGQTLRADTSGIADADGLTGITPTYQWLAGDVEIVGATASTFVLTSSELGKAIRVRVSFTDDMANNESLTSMATVEVAARPNRPATGTPSISGAAEVGETLTASTSGIADDDGLTGATFAYQWLADDAEIAGATGSAYVLTSSEMDKAIKIRVSFTDDGGNDEVLTSAATDAVSPAIQKQQTSNTAATGAPTISGTARVGETLTADTSGIADADGLTNVSYSYQWVRNNGTYDSDISGATSGTYTLVDADQGKTVKVKVSFTDDADNEEMLTSAATNPVAGMPLTASFESVPGSHDGQMTFTIELKFSESPDLSYRDVRDHVLTVAGGEVISAKRLDRPSNMRWEIKVSPGSDADVIVSLPVTTDCSVDGAVCIEDGRKLSAGVTVTILGSAQNTTATGAPTISGTAQVGETLTADTTGIADADGLSNVSYSFQWLRIDGTDAPDISGATGGTYTLVDADKGKAIKVRVSFTDDADNEETLASAPTTTVVGPVLTARSENVPGTHDGESRFSFELRFSEEFSLSYKTLRDKAFTVTGGTIKAARRLDKPSNIHWQIVIQPESTGGVTVILPITDACDDEGAICTEDGRKLSNRLEFTVSGPDA